MNISKTSVYVVALTAAFLTFTKTVSAQTPTLTDRQTIRCTQITNRIEQRITIHESRKDNILARYQRTVDRLKLANDRLKALGYDTSKLEADYQVYNEKILKIGQDYEVVIAKLEESKGYACAASQGQFASIVRAAQNQLNTVRQDITNAKQYYWNTVKPDIQALRGQKHPSPVPTQ